MSSLYVTNQMNFWKCFKTNTNVNQTISNLKNQKQTQKTHVNSYISDALSALWWCDEQHKGGPDRQHLRGHRHQPRTAAGHSQAGQTQAQTSACHN